MSDSETAIDRQRQQMLKQVAKAFYRELAKYGVAQNEVLTVANHLLDHVVAPPTTGAKSRFYNEQLTLELVDDCWVDQRALHVDGVTLRPLAAKSLDAVVAWLGDAEVRESFVPAFPATREQIFEHFHHPRRDYFEISYDDQLVGVIGAENIDERNAKLEMKKLVGTSEFRGKGIGKRATFGFLYHAFVLRKMHKVYVHSRDVNIRNLTLNTGFGFDVEGVLLEELASGDRRVDVLRMGLLRSEWERIFGRRSNDP